MNRAFEGAQNADIWSLNGAIVVARKFRSAGHFWLSARIPRHAMGLLSADYVTDPPTWRRHASAQLKPTDALNESMRTVCVLTANDLCREFDGMGQL